MNFEEHLELTWTNKSPSSSTMEASSVSGAIAMKVINHYGYEVLRVILAYRTAEPIHK